MLLKDFFSILALGVIILFSEVEVQILENSFIRDITVEILNLDQCFRIRC